MRQNHAKLKLALLLVSSLTIMSVITISPALPGMAAHYAGAGGAQVLVPLVLTVPALLIALFSPMAGRMIDRYGRLRLLWAALALYAVTGTAGFYIGELHHLLLSRALLGVAVGMSMTIVITLIADYFEGAERQKFVGIQIAFMSIGGILFIGLGGVLADIGWRYPFLIYSFSLVVLPISIAFLREPPAPTQTGAGKPSVRPPPVIWMLFINTMIMWMIFFLIPVQIPFHLKAIGIGQNALAGGAIALSTTFSAVSSFSYGRLKDRFGFLSVFSLGYLLMGAGFAFISLSETYLMVVLGMGFSGFGIGMMIPNTNMWVMKIAPPEIRGKEIGKLTTFWFFGQFISPIVIFPVVQALSLRAAFGLASGFLFLLAILFLILNVSRAGRLLVENPVKPARG